MVDVNILKEKIEINLSQQLIGARTLLGRMRVIEEKSRKTFAYNDDGYTPFYYHLGKYISPKYVLKIGFHLGLLSGCFFKSCRTVETFLGFQEAENDEYVSPRIGLANLRDFKPFPQFVHVHTGNFTDKKFIDLLNKNKWDFVIFNEEVNYDKIRLHLDLVWTNISDGGLLVVDYVNSHKPTGSVYKDFCKINNRTPVVVNTRYGVGMIEK